MGLGTGGRTITKVDTSVIKDGTITASKFAASGTASSTTVLYGDGRWAGGAAAGKRDFTDTNASATAGDVWFESSNLRFAINPNAVTGSWVTGGTMNTARKSPAGFGVQAAGVCAGGNTPSTSNVTECVVISSDSTLLDLASSFKEAESTSRSPSPSRSAA